MNNIIIIWNILCCICGVISFASLFTDSLFNTYIVAIANGVCYGLGMSQICNAFINYMERDI